MGLTEYIKSLRDREARQAFAEAVGSTIGHLRNVGYDYRPCDPALALAIERRTQCLVTRAELRPRDYWLIWPDLTAPGPKLRRRPKEEQAEAKGTADRRRPADLPMQLSASGQPVAAPPPDGTQVVVEG